MKRHLGFKTGIAFVLAACFALGAVTTASTVFAQGKAAPKVEYKKQTVYDFDDDIVEGELQRPDGEMIDTIKKADHSSLIKIREHFIPELVKSAEDI